MQIPAIPSAYTSWSPSGEGTARAGREGMAGGTTSKDESQPGRYGVDDSARRSETASGSESRAYGDRPLTPDEVRRVAELRQIDRNVRAHEAAHLAAGFGVVTSGASYGYTRGPDGKNYATSGEVGIDTSREEKPQQNIDKGQRIQAAALAPRDPSPQDYRVAAIGARLQAEGYAELARERRGEPTERERRAALQAYGADPSSSVSGAQVSVFA